MDRCGTDIVKGDRLDLKIGDKKCLSSVLRIVTPDTYIIVAPQLRNIAVPVEPGELIHVVYYRGTGMFSLMAQVESKLEEAHHKALEIVLKSPISKYQRRDFPRFDTSLPLSVRVLSDSRPELFDTDERFDPSFLVYDRRHIGKPRPPAEGMRVHSCTTSDLSGGGLKFSSDFEFPSGARVECTLTLPSGSPFTVDGEIIRSDKDEKSDDFLVCMKYVDIDERLRRRLMHIIYAEEQKVLQAAE